MGDHIKITVIDGQGGRIGSNLITALKSQKLNADIFAVGTNSIATSTMMKSGADFGATGENPVIVACRDSDIIVGPIGIVIADSLYGEITSKMAVAVGQSQADKILLPVSKCKIHTFCDKTKTVSDLINDAVETVKEIINKSYTR